MSYHEIGTELGYHLVRVNAQGEEDLEPDGTRASDAVIAALKAAPDTSDVFVLSHGWKGDVPEALSQFNRWIGQMHAVRPDLSAKRPAGYKPLVVGLHWPSLPWGDERPPAADASAVLGEAKAAGVPLRLGEEIDSYAAVLSTSEAARAALTTIVAAARGNTPATAAQLEQAYANLVTEANVEPDDELGTVETATRVEKTLGIGDIGGGFLSAVRQLSFWKMKSRARHVGQHAGGPLLERLRAAAPNARLHLMGHSFGCIVVSQAVLSGPAVDTLFLVQGALSLWAFAAKIPEETTAGALANIVGQGKVRGVIVATLSSKDTAVKDYYPVAARLGQQRVLAAVNARLPRYGGIGTFGIQGAGAGATRPIGPTTMLYPLQLGKIYNVECSTVIAKGTGPSGAHSDITHPEIAHLFWQAAMVA